MTKLAAYLKQKLRMELLAQKHAGQGTKDALLNSIDVVVNKQLEGITLEGNMLEYGLYVSRGRAKRTRRVPVFALEEWINQVGFNLREGQTVRGLAFAIRETIYKEGTPTMGSRGLAARRTDFIGTMLSNEHQKITDEVNRFAKQSIILMIEDMSRETKRILMN